MAIYIFSGEPAAYVKQAIIDDYYVPPWLCFTAQQANSTVHLDKYGSPDPISLETSTDGNTWSDYTWDGSTGDTITLTNIRDKVYFRAKNENQTISKNSNYYQFVMTGKIAASGSIQTLLKADNSRTDAPVYCYFNIFLDCSSLTTAPELPATTLVDYCYDSMFSNCTSLTTAPALPATILKYGCYYNMFNGCTSLTAAPATLLATTLVGSCYRSMFQGCMALTTAPALPAETLANNCYYSMFQGCTSLTQAPALPAETLADSCYYSMFQGCSSLTTASELPATILTNSCYRGMFWNCTSLIQAPTLPAMKLANYCYAGMFRDCTSLASIDVSFIKWSPTNATPSWVNGAGTEATGTKTFTCPAALPNTTGNNNIPSGWTRVNK